MIVPKLPMQQQDWIKRLEGKTTEEIEPTGFSNLNYYQAWMSSPGTLGVKRYKGGGDRDKHLTLEQLRGYGH